MTSFCKENANLFQIHYSSIDRMTCKSSHIVIEITRSNHMHKQALQLNGHLTKISTALAHSLFLLLTIRIDAAGKTRSKTRTLEKSKVDATGGKAESLPFWTFDGSSTGQVSTKNRTRGMFRVPFSV